MAVRLENVVVDSRDPETLAQWWAEALGWETHVESDAEVQVGERPDAHGRHPLPVMIFVPVADPALGRERVHVDLNSSSVAGQEATVQRLLAMGATPADAGQPPDAPFTVLADPEGNRFCVLDPRPECAHLGSVAGWTLAAQDAAAIGELWRVATGWTATRDDADYVVLTPPGGGPTLEIITRPTMERQAAKNRIHLDVRPTGGDTTRPRWWWTAWWRSAPAPWRSASQRLPGAAGWCSPTPRTTSSACSRHAPDEISTHHSSSDVYDRVPCAPTSRSTTT